jgi:hypothetical protein
MMMMISFSAWFSRHGFGMVCQISLVPSIPIRCFKASALHSLFFLPLQISDKKILNQKKKDHIVVVYIHDMYIYILIFLFIYSLFNQFPPPCPGRKHTMAMARGGLPGGFFGPHRVHAAVGRGAPRRHRGRLQLPLRQLAVRLAEACGGSTGFGGVTLGRGLLVEKTRRTAIPKDTKKKNLGSLEIENP